MLKRGPMNQSDAGEAPPSHPLIIERKSEEEEDDGDDAVSVAGVVQVNSSAPGFGGSVKVVSASFYSVCSRLYSWTLHLLLLPSSTRAQASLLSRRPPSRLRTADPFWAWTRGTLWRTDWWNGEEPVPSNPDRVGMALFASTGLWSCVQGGATADVQDDLRDVQTHCLGPRPERFL